MVEGRTPTKTCIYYFINPSIIEDAIWVYAPCDWKYVGDTLK